MKVCCIETRALPVPLGKKTVAWAEDWRPYIRDESICWKERAAVEKDALYKQLIPYILVRDAAGHFACYPRHGTERRLHGLYSCGIGGHIEDSDWSGTFEHTLRTGMFRELSEEFADFSGENMFLEYKGIINEVESEVGLCHLGLVFLARCSIGYRPVPTDETAGLVWFSAEELGAVKKELWSELALSLLEI